MRHVSIALLSWLAMAPSISAGGPPNVLLVVVDDLGTDYVDDYGIAPPGEPPTPNVTALVQAGTRFTRAWSNTVCSPTRATLQTGRFSFRTGVGTVINPWVNPTPALSPQAERTLPELLSLQGYTSAAFGKWHLGIHPDDGGPRAPVAHGYDRFIGVQGNLGRIDGTGDYLDYDRITADADGSLTIDFGVSEYVTDATTGWATDWIASAPEPWFAYVAYNAPHTPLHYPPESLYELSLPDCPGGGVGCCDSADPESTPGECFAAMVESLDVELGELVAGIPVDQAERTVIVFLSDNGTPTESIREPWEPFQAKGSEFEGGIRVPLVIVDPSVPVEHQGRVEDALVNTTDVFATVLELAGLPTPPPDALDAGSLVRYLTGQTPARERRLAYSESFLPNGVRPSHCQIRRAARDEQYKLIQERQRDQATVEQMFDLSVDPFEKDDRIEELRGTEPYLDLRQALAALTGSEEPITDPIACEDVP